MREDLSTEYLREFLDAWERKPDPCAGLTGKAYLQCVVEHQIG